MERKDGVKGLDSTNEWHWYEKSALSNLLRHDTWPWKLALPSICDIDMDNSGRSDAWGGLMLFDPESEDIFGVSFAHVALLSEDPIYQLPPIKDPNNSDLSEYAQRLAAFMQDLEQVDVEVDTSDISVRMSKRHHAYTKLRQAHKIFMSNPDHAATDTYEPAYFLSWAKEKDIEVPWLNWAQKRDLVDIVIRPSPSSTIQRGRIEQSLDRRAETTNLNVIGALLELMFDKSSLNKPNSIFNNQTDVINALLDKYESKQGIKKRTLEERFSQANKSISQK